MTGMGGDNPFGKKVNKYRNYDLVRPSLEEVFAYCDMQTCRLFFPFKLFAPFLKRLQTCNIHTVKVEHNILYYNLVFDLPSPPHTFGGKLMRVYT